MMARWWLDDGIFNTITYWLTYQGTFRNTYGVNNFEGDEIINYILSSMRTPTKQEKKKDKNLGTNHWLIMQQMNFGLI